MTAPMNETTERHVADELASVLELARESRAPSQRQRRDRMSNLKPCPKCGNPDELTLDSNSAAEASWIECGWCEHRMQARCDEETLVERWDKLSRKKMPAFDLDAEMARLEGSHGP